MTEKLVSFEVAKLLKEKGFNEWCEWGIHSNTGEIIDLDVYPEVGRLNQYMKEYCSMPTQALAQRWLRENHKIHIVLQDSFNMETNEIKYYPVLYPFGKQYDNLPTSLRREKGEYVYLGKVWKDTYEEALEIGLKEALKLI